MYSCTSKKEVINKYYPIVGGVESDSVKYLTNIKKTYLFGKIWKIRIHGLDSSSSFEISQTTKISLVSSRTICRERGNVLSKNKEIVGFYISKSVSTENMGEVFERIKSYNLNGYKKYFFKSTRPRVGKYAFRSKEFYTDSVGIQHKIIIKNPIKISF